jgi:hypothetical protein
MMPLSYSLYTAGYISVWTHIDVVVACVIAIFLLFINHCSSAMATYRRSYHTYYCWLFWYSSYYATTTTATAKVLTTKHNSPQLNHLCMFASAQGAKAFAVTCGRQMIHYTKFDIYGNTNVNTFSYRAAVHPVSPVPSSKLFNSGSTRIDC